jgi:hypothetical protein
MHVIGQGQRRGWRRAVQGRVWGLGFRLYYTPHGHFTTHLESSIGVADGGARFFHGNVAHASRRHRVGVGRQRNDVVPDVQCLLGVSSCLHGLV